MKTRLILQVVIMLMVTTSACSPVSPASISSPTIPPAPTYPPPPITASDPASVVIAYYGALSVKNVDAAMTLVAEDPELCYPKCLTDKDQVLAFWEHELLSYIPYVSVLEVNGNTVTYVYAVVHNGRVDGYGTGKIVVEDGKVKSDH
jgi:hypothetical protein